MFIIHLNKLITPKTIRKILLYYWFIHLRPASSSVIAQKDYAISTNVIKPDQYNCRKLFSNLGLYIYMYIYKYYILIYIYIKN